MDEEVNEFLTFMLAGEEYGLDILRVQEIKGWDDVTSLPNMPEYVRGVINLRGTIVPIIDLRRRFSLEALEYGPTTVVIVLRVQAVGHSDRKMGIVVDAVSDVYQVPKSDLKVSPDFGSAVDTEFVSGLATVGEKMIILLAIDHMLNSDELCIIDALVG
ncbi:chemotaxis protein CheW [Beggiatoa alba]|nr:chemotaxis protein CheW [Beggiatoa alba]